MSDEIPEERPEFAFSTSGSEALVLEIKRRVEGKIPPFDFDLVSPTEAFAFLVKADSKIDAFSPALVAYALLKHCGAHNVGEVVRKKGRLETKWSSVFCLRRYESFFKSAVKRKEDLSPHMPPFKE